ncbi:MAG TPA: hypothetical protein VM098_09335, partial [Phycisphaerae bacterium]|nr:hypothetical protein [Phycisphaerae bacterium]
MAEQVSPRHRPATPQVGRLHTDARRTSGARSGPWPTVAVVALVLTAMAANFTREQDFDAFWHLAAGKWMLGHQAVLDFDPYTSEPEDPNARWVNVYWLFQVILAALHSVGGFSALTVLQCLMAGAAFFVFAASLRRHVAPGWLIFSGLVMVPVFANRMRMRPEMFTLPFLMATVALLEHARRDGRTRRLWWLVPIMLTWVNMHGLYFLGLVLIWTAMLGALVDSRLRRGAMAGSLPTQAALAPLLLATAVCLVSPWPLESMLHPLKLWSRISGEAFYYTYGVAEFRPTYEHLSAHPVAMALLGLSAAAMAVNARRVPISHLLWLVPFGLLGLMAVRNLSLLAPVCGYLLAWHGGQVLGRIASGRNRLARAGRYATWAMAAAALAAVAGYATEYTYRVTGSGRRFGAGLARDYYPVALAKYLGSLQAPGDVLALNFGDASTFIYYSYPTRRVWMDGRLEIRSLERFRRQHDMKEELKTRQSAARVRLPRSVRFLIARRDARRQLAAMMQCPRFRLIRVDPAGACFARLDYSDGRPISQLADELPEMPNLSDFDRPLGPDGLVVGIGGARRRWYRNNPYSVSCHIGSLMLFLGDDGSDVPPGSAGALQRQCSLLAVRYLAAAHNEALLPEAAVAGMLAQAHQQWAHQTAQSASIAAPIDIDLARALHLYGGIDMSALDELDLWTFGLMHIRGQIQGRHLDAAIQTADAFLEMLPPRERMNPPPEYVQMRNTLAAHLDKVSARLLAIDTRAMSPLELAGTLSSHEMGLSLRAVKELQAAPNLDANALLALGDLLLRQGRPAAARQVYGRAARAGAVNSSTSL